MGTFFGTMDGVMKRIDALQKQVDEYKDRLLKERDELVQRALAQGISLEQINRLLKTDGKTSQNNGEAKKEEAKNDS